MNDPRPRRDGLSGWFRAKLDGLAPPGDSAAPAAPALEDLAAEVARLGWDESVTSAAVPPKPTEEEAEASARRLAYIMAYTRAPEGDPDFADESVLFSILSKEQVYQRREVRRLAAVIAALPPPGAAMGLTPEEIAANPRFAEAEAVRATLIKAHAQATAAQAKIFRLMKKLVGMAGLSTGGTGPLVEAPAADAPLSAVFDHLDDILRRSRPE